MLIDFSNHPLSSLTLVYECQECGAIKKSFDLNVLPELKAASSSEAPEPKETPKNADAPAIPIEREPPINR